MTSGRSVLNESEAVVSLSVDGESHHDVARLVHALGGHGALAVTWFTQRFDLLEQRMWRAISARAPSIGHLRGSACYSARLACRHIGRVFLKCLSEDRNPNERERHHLWYAGYNAAQLGVELDDLREAVRVGSNATGEMVLEFLQAGFVDHAIVDNSALVFRALQEFVESVYVHMIEGFTAAPKELARETDAAPSRQLLAEDLLNRNFNTLESSSGTGCSTCQQRRHERWWVIVLAAADSEAPKLRDAIDYLRGQLADGVSSRRSHLGVLAHKALLTPRDTLSPSRVASQVGQTARKLGVYGLIESTETPLLIGHAFEFLQALLGAIPIVRPNVGLLECEDLLSEAIVPGQFSLPVAFKFVRRALGEMPQVPVEQSNAIMKVVREIAGNGGTPNSTAEKLGAHRSTVYRHLKAFRTLSGRDIRDPAELRLVGGAVRLLEHWELPEFGDAVWSWPEWCGHRQDANRFQAPRASVR